MRKLKSAIQKDGSGSVTLLPEEPEDMWHAYNLIQPTDLVRAATMRRVAEESSSGSVRTHRQLMTFTIRVTKTDFDTGASQLRVSGRIVEGPEGVDRGSHHTLELELQRKFEIEKGEGWDSVALQQLDEALDSTKRASLWAVLLGDGVANICLVTEYQTRIVQHISSPIPKKRASSSDTEKGTRRFFTLVWDTLQRALDLPTLKAEDLPSILFASPGFTAQNFLKFVKDDAVRTGSKIAMALGTRITVTHASSPHLQALAEIMKSPAVTSQLRDTKFARESKLLDNFYEHLRADDGKAWYGPKEVIACVNAGAVGRGGGVLLISNNLFRSQDIATRKKWVALVDRVRETEGGEVRVLSEAHESGKRLEALGGIAALLSYPIYEIEEDEEGDEAAAPEGGT